MYVSPENGHVFSDSLTGDVLMFSTRSNQRLLFGTKQQTGAELLVSDGSLSIARRLGIGTATPNVTLDMGHARDAVALPAGSNGDRPLVLQAGQIRFDAEHRMFEGYDGQAWVRLDGLSDQDGDTFIRAESALGSNEDTLVFFTSNQERARITSSGLVGISQSNPLTSLDIGATDALGLPAGTTAQRPAAPRAGLIRYNTDRQRLEYYDSNTSWTDLTWSNLRDDDGDTYVYASNDNTIRVISSNLNSLSVGPNQVAVYGRLDISVPYSNLPFVENAVDSFWSKNASNDLYYVQGKVGISTSLPRVSLHINSTDAVALPVGTSAQRPAAPLDGMVRFNADARALEVAGYSNATWAQVLARDSSGARMTAHVLPSADDLIDLGRSNERFKDLFLGGAQFIGDSAIASSNDIGIHSNAGIGNSFGLFVTGQSRTLKAIGKNTFGQLGDGTTTDRTSGLVNVPGVSNVLDLACGDAHAVLLTSTGDVLGAGLNDAGQLGSRTLATSNFVGIPGISNAVEVACGFSHTAVLDRQGQCIVFGDNSFGQLGNNSTVPSSVPSPVPGISNAVRVACGPYSTMIVTSTGNLFGFGDNAFGQLGDGTTVQRSNPALAVGVSNAVDLACGNAHTLVLTSDGRVLSFGNNLYGQLGRSAFLLSSNPEPMASLSNATSVACGLNHSLVTTSAGSEFAFGRNQHGQLGDATTSNKPTPQSVPAASNAVVRAIAGYDSSFLFERWGRVLAFGKNDFGQLGDGTSLSKSNATPVANLEVNFDQSQSILLRASNVVLQSLSVGDYLMISSDCDISTSNLSVQNRLAIGSTGVTYSNDGSLMFECSNLRVNKIFVYSQDDAFAAPAGNTAQRPGNPRLGEFRFNTSLNEFEGYSSNAWLRLRGVHDANGDTFIASESAVGSNEDYLRFVTASNERMRISSNGFVGIGTSNPQVVLDIVSQGAVALPAGGTAARPAGPRVGFVRYNSDLGSFEGWASGAWTTLGGVRDADRDTFVAAELDPSSNDNTLRFVTSNLERMRITPTGSVGVKTVSPQYDLHVAGSFYAAGATLGSLDATGSVQAAGGYRVGDQEVIDAAGNVVANGLRLTTATGAPVLFVDANGRVGIGTQVPTAELDVIGNLKTSGTNASAVFFAPPNWGYSSTTLNQWVQLWSFTFNAPVNGIAVISVTGHWSHSVTNNSAYMGILVNNSHVNVSSLYDSFTVGAASIQGGYSHHYWANVSSWVHFSHACCVKLNAGNNTIGLGSYHFAGTVNLNGAAISMKFMPLFTM